MIRGSSPCTAAYCSELGLGLPKTWWPAPAVTRWWMVLAGRGEKGK